MDGLLTGGLAGKGSGLLTGGLYDLLGEAGDPGPDPDPTEGPGRIVIAVQLGQSSAVPAFKLELP